MSSNHTSKDAVIKKEEEILREEKEILKEVKNEEREIKKSEKRILLAIFGIFLAILIGGITYVYMTYAARSVGIDKAQISAPLIDLAPSAPGVLQWVSVHEGDRILPNTIVAQIGNNVIKSKLGGLVVAVKDNVGKLVNPGEAVVTTIDPNDLRVVGSLEENKGLQDIQVGQQAVFTVDAFGSRKFYGVVDEISPTSEESGIVFNISDKRETKIFDVKIRYDVAQYPELKNGMSAKITVMK
jgi:multidrug resistance efflux pump